MMLLNQGPSQKAGNKGQQKANSGQWNGKPATTRWHNTKFTPAAWYGSSTGKPIDKTTDDAGTADFWAPPRGYVVYVPV